MSTGGGGGKEHEPGGRTGTAFPYLFGGGGTGVLSCVGGGGGSGGGGGKCRVGSDSRLFSSSSNSRTVSLLGVEVSCCTAIAAVSGSLRMSLENRDIVSLRYALRLSCLEHLSFI